MFHILSFHKEFYSEFIFSPEILIICAQGISSLPLYSPSER